MGPLLLPAADLRRAIHLLRPKYEGLTAETLLVSSTTGTGVPEVWQAVEAVHQHLRATGQLDALRAGQAKAWLWDEIRSGLLEHFRAEHPRTEIDAIEAAVMAGEVAPGVAAQQLLDGIDGATGA